MKLAGFEALPALGLEAAGEITKRNKGRSNVLRKHGFGIAADRDLADIRYYAERPLAYCMERPVIVADN